MSHPARARLAEIIVTRPGGGRRRGSGYLVAPGWVLTAAHVVAGAESAAVWFGAPRILERESGVGLDTRTVLHASKADLALLPVGPPRSPESRDKVLLGQLDRRSPAEIPVVAAGFPIFKLRPDPDQDAVLLREVEYATGMINAASNVKTDTYKFVVLAAPADSADHVAQARQEGLASQTSPAESPDDPPQAARSPWEGMSGAAVFASGRIVGVVAQHHRDESAGVLTVRPLTDLFTTQSAEQLVRWQQALPQLGSSADELANVTPPTAAELTERRAQRVAAGLAPPVLVARDDELAALASFVASRERWRWVQGAAFAGKTALLAWFALHPPQDLDIAACFLRRTSSAADAGYALDVLNRQLARHADGRGYSLAPHISDQRDDFLELLEDAARASRDRGRRLLVLVDGLDEDQTAEPELRVAAWLPGSRELPDSAWLLVASRAGVAVRLPSRHPLTGQVMPLSASEAAGQIAELAERELMLARTGGGLAARLLGILTAAASGLTTTELTSLLRRTRPDVLQVEVTDVLNGQLARTVFSQSDPEIAGGAAWSFAHDALLESAIRQFGADLPLLGGELLDWCHDLALRPDTDPDGYVARHYAERLAEAETWTDRWNDLLAPVWAALRGRSSARYLPHREDLGRLLHAARRFNGEAVAAGRAAPALACAVAATARLAEIESQFKSTSADLAAALVQTGQWTHARALQYVASIRDGTERAVALGKVAAVLDPHPQNVSAVLELYDLLDGQFHDERGQAALAVARLLAAGGRSQDAVALARAEAAAGRFSEACNAAAGALPGLPSRDAGRLLAAIREWSGQLSRFDLWNFAARLRGSLSREQARRALKEVEPGVDAGDYLLGLFAIPPDDIGNLAAAVQLAAPWFGQRRLSERCRELLDAAPRHPVTEAAPARRIGPERAASIHADVLAELASVAPAGLRQEILRRSENVPVADRMRVLAGLLVTDHGGRAARILGELSPMRLPLGNIRSYDDRRAFLVDLARSGHGRLAIDYLKTARVELDAMAAIAEHLGPQDLADLVGLARRVEPALQAQARAAVFPALVRAAGQAGSGELVWGTWPDAVRLAGIGAGWVAPGDEIVLPADQSLRLAAVLVAAADGLVSSDRCLEVIAALPATLVVPVLTQALTRLPVDDDTVHDPVDYCLSASASVEPIEGIRLVRAAFQAICARMGALATFIMFVDLRDTDPWLTAQLIAACGDQLIEADIARSDLIARIAGTEHSLTARAALAQYAGNPRRELQRVAAMLDLLGLKSRNVHELSVLEALPWPQRAQVLERLVRDGFLDGSRPLFSRANTWAASVTLLVPSMSPRQLRTVAEAVGSFKDLGGGPRSALNAAIAVRWARLADFAMFSSALDGVTNSSDVAAALTGSVLHLQPAHLPDWYHLADRLDPGFDAQSRAVLWALARFRSHELDREGSWATLDRWLAPQTATKRAKFDEPWQVLVDLVGFYPALVTCGGPDTGAQLRDLLASDQFLGITGRTW